MTNHEERAVVTAQQALGILTKDQWFKEARRAALHFWCYEDLVDDAVDSCVSAQLAGDDPYDTIKAIGQSLDLHEFGPAWS